MCPAGKYSGEGEISCTGCPKGQNGLVEGQSSCTNCTAGKSEVELNKHTHTQLEKGVRQSRGGGRGVQTYIFLTGLFNRPSFPAHPRTPYSLLPFDIGLLSFSPHSCSCLSTTKRFVVVVVVVSRLLHLAKGPRHVYPVPGGAVPGDSRQKHVSASFHSQARPSLLSLPFIIAVLNICFFFWDPPLFLPQTKKVH